MKITAVNFVFAALSGLALFSTADAADLPHAMHDRAREIRLDRGERVGRVGHEREAGKNFGRELAGREHAAREHEGRQLEGREFHSAGAVHPLPLYARAQPERLSQDLPQASLGTKR